MLDYQCSYVISLLDPWWVKEYQIRKLILWNILVETVTPYFADLWNYVLLFILRTMFSFPYLVWKSFQGLSWHTNSPKPALFLMASRGQFNIQWLYVSLWENGSTSHLINYLSKQSPNVFMVSITSFKSSTIQPDVYLVHFSQIWSKVDDIWGCTLGRGYHSLSQIYWFI